MIQLFYYRRSVMKCRAFQTGLHKLREQHLAIPPKQCLAPKGQQSLWMLHFSPSNCRPFWKGTELFYNEFTGLNSVWGTDERSRAAKLFWDNLQTFWTPKSKSLHHLWQKSLRKSSCVPESEEGAAISWYFLHYMLITQSSYISGTSLVSIIILPL